jgi:hypothetical protein
MISTEQQRLKLKKQKNLTRIDGRMNFEYRNINFKFNVIPSSLASFYVEFGSNKFLFAIFVSMSDMKGKKIISCHLETILFEPFEKTINSNSIEKGGFNLNSIVERTILSTLFPSSRFFILIRKIKNDGNLRCHLTWASQILIVLSNLPYKIKIGFKNLGLTKKAVFIDPTTEELFFSKTYLEIISTDDCDGKILMLLGSNFENFINLEEALGYLGNNFFKFLFVKLVPSRYSFSFL